MVSDRPHPLIPLSFRRYLRLSANANGIVSPIPVLFSPFCAQDVAFALRSSRIGCKKKQVGESEKSSRGRTVGVGEQNRSTNRGGRCNRRVALIGLPFCAIRPRRAATILASAATQKQTTLHSRPPTLQTPSKVSCNRSIIITNAKLKCHFAPASSS